MSYIYINNKMAINLGGNHMREQKTLDLGTLGLTSGQTYAIDIFFVDRGGGGCVFYLATNITFNNKGAVKDTAYSTVDIAYEMPGAQIAKLKPVTISGLRAPIWIPGSITDATMSINRLDGKKLVEQKVLQNNIVIKGSSIINALPSGVYIGIINFSDKYGTRYPSQNRRIIKMR